MTDSVLFGDIEDALVDWLDTKLAPVRSYVRIPRPREAPFVVVQRLGGPRVSVVTEQATVTVEAYGKSDKGAHDLAQLARRAIHETPGEILGGLVFYRVNEFSGPARLPDPTSNDPRFVFTVSITVRGFTSS